MAGIAASAAKAASRQPLPVASSLAHVTKRPSWLRRIAGVTTVGGTAAGVFAYFEAKRTMGDDAVNRIISYDMVAVPGIIEYKWLEAKCEKLPKYVPWIFPPVSDEEERELFEVLHRKWAPILFDKFMELGGFYYKSGQKIASNFGGVSPKIYVDMFQPFLNNIPPRDPAEVRAVVESELGRPREEVFATFDETPIGCASIGQAHRATLRATGERVVVKVQNPEAERTFRGDVFALKTLVDAFMPQVSPAFDEIAKQFATEFDYRGEAQNAIDVHRNLQQSPFRHVVTIPRVHVPLCSKRLMVMEEIHPSVPLHTALDEQAGTLARQRGISKEQFIASEKARVERESFEAARKGKLQAPGASHSKLARQLSSNTYDKYIRFQKAKRALVRAWRHAYNGSVGLLLPSRRYDMRSGGADDVLVPINAAKLVDELLAVHGYEVLIDGCFNADPHPGNVLYLDGKIALIDYGQVKRITDKERLDLAKLLLLVGAAIPLDPRTNPSVHPTAHQRARAGIAAHSRAIGVQTEKMDPDVAYEMGVVYYGRMDAAWLYPQNFLQWTDSMQARDPLTTLEDVEYFVMVGTVSMMLRGLGEVLQQYRNLATCWGPYARQALAQKGQLADVEAEIASWTYGLPPKPA